VTGAVGVSCESPNSVKSIFELFLFSLSAFRHATPGFRLSSRAVAPSNSTFSANASVVSCDPPHQLWCSPAIVFDYRHRNTSLLWHSHSAVLFVLRLTRLDRILVMMVFWLGRAPGGRGPRCRRIWAYGPALRRGRYLRASMCRSRRSPQPPPQPHPHSHPQRRRHVGLRRGHLWEGVF
jgi:hypothetical protein